MTTPLEPEADITIRRASSPEDRAAFADLVREYVGWLAVDLGYQGLEAELGDLARVYGAPGAILLAVDPRGRVLGGIAVKPLPALGRGVCEMKRLYVRPAGRGLGLGKRLVDAAMAEARANDFTTMVLDTMPSRMGSAVTLYTALGFTARAPYYATPVEETVFLERAL